MTDTTTRKAPALTARRLRRVLPGGGSTRDPLFRNAYALMLNTGVSAILGLGYWLIAARFYPEAAVGRGSAAIAAMKFLAGITAVTLTGALARFIPISGERTGRFIFRTYLASSAVVAAAAGVFLLTLRLWGPSYQFLRGPLPGLLFVVAVIAWSVMTLQDGVLTGLRSAVWVPVGNTVFSTGKLILLVLLAAAIPATGVFVSWVAAIGLSVLPLGWLVFRRLIPRHAAATKDRARPPTAREVGRFLAGDYTGSLFALAVVYLVPVLVASQISAKDNAYFYITSTIGGTLDLLAINMGASLTVEGAHDPSRITANLRAALGRMARIMIPVCMFLVVFAPYVLRVFGPGYAAEGTPLLRLMALSTLTRVLFEAYFGVLRAMSRTTPVAVLQGVLCVLILSSTMVLLRVMGIVGAGVAELASQSVIAVIASIGLVRLLRADRQATGLAGATAGAPLSAAEAEAMGTDSPVLVTPVDQDTLALRIIRPRTDPAGAAGRPVRPVMPIDEDTLALGLRLDFDHPERRPYVTPPAGVPVVPASAAVPAADRPEAAPAAAAPSAAVALRPAAGTPAGGGRPPASARPARPPVPARSRRERLTDAAGWLLLVVALALYWLPVSRMDNASLNRMNGLGLISVLPPATLCGAALLVAAFCFGLFRRTPQKALLLTALVATVFSLHGLPAVLEAQPRFATAWQHSGFVEYISRTGMTRPYLDARFSWPGFFAVAALASGASGVQDLTEVLRWWPTAMELLYLAPMMLMLKGIRASWRAKWCAVWLFALCSWVGQDYFSPQSLNIFLYLMFVALLLVWFGSPKPTAGRSVAGEEKPPSDVRRGHRVVLALLLMGVFTASVVSHQLTPFMMLGVVLALVVWRRSNLRGLPLWCGVLVIGWVGFLAEPYWSGHFNSLFGGVGSLGGNVSSSVTGRIHSGSNLHELVLYARVMLAGAVLALGAVGWLRRRLNGISDRSLLILLLIPFLSFGMQSYGGEIALRVFLFALPAAAVLGALAFFPRLPDTEPATTGPPGDHSDAPPGGLPDGPSGRASRRASERAAARRGRPRRTWIGPLAALLAGQVLIFGFLLARWGNESFERVRTGEVAAMDFVYAHDTPTARVLWPTEDTVNDVTPNLPWGADDMEKMSYQGVLAPLDPAQVGGMVTALRAAGPQSYLMITSGMSQYLELNAGYPADWQHQVVAALDASPELRLVMSDTDADVYELATPVAAPIPQPNPGPDGPVITWTAWTVCGAIAGVLLLLLLAAREVARVLVAAERLAPALRVSFWVAMPLLAVFLAALVDRFATLS